MKPMPDKIFTQNLLAHQLQESGEVAVWTCFRLAYKWAALTSMNAEFKYSALNMKKTVVKQVNSHTALAGHRPSEENFDPNAPDAYIKIFEKVGANMIAEWSREVTDANKNKYGSASFAKKPIPPFKGSIENFFKENPLADAKSAVYVFMKPGSPGHSVSVAMENGEPYLFDPNTGRWPFKEEEKANIGKAIDAFMNRLYKDFRDDNYVYIFPLPALELKKTQQKTPAPSEEELSVLEVRLDTLRNALQQPAAGELSAENLEQMLLERKQHEEELCKLEDKVYKAALPKDMAELERQYKRIETCLKWKMGDVSVVAAEDKPALQRELNALKRQYTDLKPVIDARKRWQEAILKTRKEFNEKQKIIKKKEEMPEEARAAELSILQPREDAVTRAARENAELEYKRSIQTLRQLWDSREWKQQTAAIEEKKEELTNGLKEQETVARQQFQEISNYSRTVIRQVAPVLEALNDHLQTINTTLEQIDGAISLPELNEIETTIEEDITEVGEEIEGNIADLREQIPELLRRPFSLTEEQRQQLNSDLLVVKQQVETLRLLQGQSFEQPADSRNLATTRNYFVQLTTHLERALGQPADQTSFDRYNVMQFNREEMNRSVDLLVGAHQASQDAQSAAVSGLSPQQEQSQAEQQSAPQMTTQPEAPTLAQEVPQQPAQPVSSRIPRYHRRQQSLPNPVTQPPQPQVPQPIQEVQPQPSLSRIPRPSRRQHSLPEPITQPLQPEVSAPAQEVPPQPSSSRIPRLHRRHHSLPEPVTQPLQPQIPAPIQEVPPQPSSSRIRRPANRRQQPLSQPATQPLQPSPNFFRHQTGARSCMFKTVAECPANRSYNNVSAKVDASTEIAYFKIGGTTRDPQVLWLSPAQQGSTRVEHNKTYNIQITPQRQVQIVEVQQQGRRSGR